MEALTDLISEAVKLNAYRYEGVGTSGIVEIGHVWHHQFSQVTRIELLDNWIKVLTAQLNMEKALKREERGNE